MNSGANYYLGGSSGLYNKIPRLSMHFRKTLETFYDLTPPKDEGMINLTSRRLQKFRFGLL